MCRCRKIKLQNEENVVKLGGGLPIALYRGLPHSLSHTTVVSLWFVMPTAGNNNPNIDAKHLNLKTILKTSFFKFLEDFSSFCGVTDTPVFGLLMTSALGFKARVALLVYFVTCVQCIPKIHLWCITC